MLESLVNELTEKDYLYIFIDGKHNENKARTIINKIINLFVCEVIIKVEDEPLGNWGHGLRNKYQSTLKGDYIMHADDDDTYIKGSFNKIREKINETDNDETIFYYRFNYRYNSNLTVWYTPELMGGNIGTPSGVIPNKPELFGEWKNKHGGDYDFYSTCKFTNQIFVDEIIYVVNSYIEKVDDVKLKIGIVIPTYQRQDGLSFVYLTNALNSIKNQTFKDYKVFLIGDRYEDNDEFIKIATSIIDSDKIYYENLPFAEERDKYGDNNLALWRYGGVNATNHGIEISLSQGYDYICHLDHDDTWESNHLSLISNTITKTDASFVFTKSKHKNSIFPNITSDDEIIEILPKNEALIHSSVCMNFKEIPLRYRDIFKETGVIGLPADGDLWNRVREWIIKNDLKSYLINKMTCVHEKEGNTLNNKLNSNIKIKKVVLISTYCDTQEKIDILEKNIDNVKNCGIDVIVISPFFLPESIQKKCDYFFLMKDNPVLEWPQKAIYFWKILKLGDKSIKITKTVPDYGWAGLYQVKKLSEIALSLDYDYFYHIIYDIKFDETIINGLLSERECDVYSSKRDDTIWEVGLHFMVFNRENLQKFISYITLQNYLDCDGGDAFVWLHRLINIFPYNIVRTPVEDEIYYYEGKDFFNSSPIEDLKFFVDKNDEESITVKLLFYDINKPKNILLTIGENKYQYDMICNSLFDLGFDKYNTPYVSIEYNGINYEITKIIEKIKHNTLKEIE
jgi:hypothetical protein